MGGSETDTRTRRAACAPSPRPGSPHPADVRGHAGKARSRPCAAGGARGTRGTWNSPGRAGGRDAAPPPGGWRTRARVRETRARAGGGASGRACPSAGGRGFRRPVRVPQHDGVDTTLSHTLNTAGRGRVAPGCGCPRQGFRFSRSLIQPLRRVRDKIQTQSTRAARGGLCGSQGWGRLPAGLARATPAPGAGMRGLPVPAGSAPAPSELLG